MAKVTVIALRPFRGDEGFVQPKQTLVIEERRAAQLVQRGLVTYEVGEKSRIKAEAAAPRNKELAVAPKTASQPAGAPAAAKAGGEAAAADPTYKEEAQGSSIRVRRSGTRTGRAKPPSSSQPARPRGK